VAVICLWVSAALGLLMTVAQVTSLVPNVGGATPGMIAAIGLLTVGILVFLAFKINSGRNWARWTFAVVYLLGSFGSIILVLLTPALFAAAPAIVQMNMIAQFGLQTAVVVLTFLPVSGPWFKAKPATNS
jgi:hypothetical protein